MTAIFYRLLLQSDIEFMEMMRNSLEFKVMLCKSAWPDINVSYLMSYIIFQLHVADFSCRFLNKNDKKKKYHYSFRWCRCSVVCTF